MNDHIIEESGMAFVVVPEDTYRIEKEPYVQKSLPGMTCCEFITLNSDKDLVFVEAKTSFSNPDNKKDYNKNFDEIFDKVKDSISVFNSLLLRHQGLDEWGRIPNHLREIDLTNVIYKIYIVIKKHKDEWLVPLQNDAPSKFKTILHMWNIPQKNLKLINEDMARQLHLIE